MKIKDIDTVLLHRKLFLRFLLSYKNNLLILLV